MNYFAGLDVSLELTSVCVVDGEGGIVREAKVLSEPDALVAFFGELDVAMTRIFLEAGPLSQWLHDGLAEAGLPVVCAETRQLKAVLSATVNMSDRNDARGIAQMVRVNLIRPVHVKTVLSQEKRMLLTNRKFMLKQLCDAEGNIRGTLRNFGLKIGPVTRRGLEARVLDLVADRPVLASLVEPMLNARATLLAGVEVDADLGQQQAASRGYGVEIGVKVEHAGPPWLCRTWREKDQLSPVRRALARRVLSSTS